MKFLLTQSIFIIASDYVSYRSQPQSGACWEWDYVDIDISRDIRNHVLLRLNVNGDSEYASIVDECLGKLFEDKILSGYASVPLVDHGTTNGI